MEEEVVLVSGPKQRALYRKLIAFRPDRDCGNISMLLRVRLGNRRIEHLSCGVVRRDHSWPYLGPMRTSDPGRG